MQCLGRFWCQGDGRLPPALVEDDPPPPAVKGDGPLLPARHASLRLESLGFVPASPPSTVTAALHGSSQTASPCSPYRSSPLYSASCCTGGTGPVGLHVSPGTPPHKKGRWACTLVGSAGSSTTRITRAPMGRWRFHEPCCAGGG